MLSSTKRDKEEKKGEVRLLIQSAIQTDKKQKLRIKLEIPISQRAKRVGEFVIYM